jgi:hypothetical protein
MLAEASRLLCSFISWDLATFCAVESVAWVPGEDVDVVVPDLLVSSGLVVLPSRNSGTPVGRAKG